MSSLGIRQKLRSFTALNRVQEHLGRLFDGFQVVQTDCDPGFTQLVEISNIFLTGEKFGV
jgi:hypothetical protein